MYYSSRNKQNKVSSSFALLHGLASDSGLFLMEEIPHFSLEKLYPLSYPELAYEILSPLFDDFSKEEIQYCIDKAYNKSNFADGMVEVKTFASHSFLELFKGPTLAFKDMALTLLPFLMEVAMKHLKKEKLSIVTATSGDTGSAALSAFSKSDKIQIKVLYPEKGISPIQEKQMLYFTSPSSRAYALKGGDFDDCQSLAKECLSLDKENLSSANSINIGRLLPQTIYYFYAYFELVRNKVISLGEEIDVIVPTGNFGNIFALYLSKKMGLPISHLVCASNKNDVLDQFFKTGVYDARRELYVTNSPSMDILVSSNLERLLSLILPQEKLLEKMRDLKEKKVFSIEEEYRESLKDFLSCSASEEETLLAMRDSFEKDHYLIDPHTAVAYHAYLKRKKEFSHHVLIAATASFYKFPKAVKDALHLQQDSDDDILKEAERLTKVKHPKILDDIKECHTPKYVIDKDTFKKELSLKKDIDIYARASSANLGSCFDIAGLSLSLYNRYRFSRNDKDEVIHFQKGYDVDHNLVLKAYHYYFKKLQMKEIPVRIEAIEENIPISRGLGSSSACIVAGILGANEISNQKASKQELLEMMMELEGHGDNVAPSFLGGYQTLIKQGNTYQAIEREVNPEWNFYAYIPSSRVSTKKARGLLPLSYPKDVVISSLSHASLLPYALEKEDLSLLQEVFNDLIHQPYRYPLIQGADKIREFALSHDAAICISGSGSTLLLISKNKDLEKEYQKMKNNKDALFLKLTIERGSTKIEENYHE